VCQDSTKRSAGKVKQGALNYHRVTQKILCRYLTVQSDRQPAGGCVACQKFNQ
jgi:hypothetical protein